MIDRVLTPGKSVSRLAGPEGAKDQYSVAEGRLFFGPFRAGFFTSITQG
jgi:hypothetical protein